MKLLLPFVLICAAASTCTSACLAQLTISRIYRVQPAEGVTISPGAPGEMKIEVKQPGTILSLGQGYWFSPMGEISGTTLAPTGKQVTQKFGAPWVSNDVFKGESAAGTWKLQLDEVKPGTTSRAVWWQLAITTLRPPEMKLPITGRAVPQLASLDTAMVEFMDGRGFEAASLAVVKDGRLVFSRGYGWQDRELSKPIDPNAVLRLGSNSKPVIAAAVQRLIAEGQLSEDDKVLPLLDIVPPKEHKLGDERWNAVTIRHLLEHKSGLPQYWASSSEVRKKLGLSRVALRDDVISYMETQPLQSDPGEKYAYSNFGYALLAVLIERATGRPYDEYIRDKIMLPIGVRSLRLGKQLPEQQVEDEAWFAEERMETTVWDEDLTLPDSYAEDFTTGLASGSMLSSASDYCRFMRFYYLDGKLKPTSLHGIDFQYQHNGSLPGCMAIAKQKVAGGESLEYCVLLNKRRSEHPEDFDALSQVLDKALAGVDEWPTTDLWAQR